MQFGKIFALFPLRCSFVLLHRDACGPTNSLFRAPRTEAEDDDTSTTSKFASVKFIASVAAGCFCLAAALAVRWCLLHRRGKKTVVIEYPRLAPIKERPGAPVAYARPVASAPPLAPLAPEPPLASIKERALAEAAHATEPSPAYDPER